MAAGVVVGFIAMLFLFFIPVVGSILGPILGGFISGVIAGGGAGRGSLSGFLSGVSGFIVMAIVIWAGAEWLENWLGLGGVLSWILGAFAGSIASAMVVTGFFCGFLALVGGAVGGAIRPEKKEKSVSRRERYQYPLAERRERRALPESPVEVEVLGEDSPEAWEGRVKELQKREQDLRADLAVLKTQRETEAVSPELLKAREGELQKALLDVVLEKERLARKLKERE